MEESNEYQEILNRGKEIIREMKEIRVKYGSLTLLKV